MKIKHTFFYTKYENSKLATAISMLKSGFAGFLAWIGLFLLPLLIGCGIASQYGAAGVVAIIIGIIAIISYFCLFLIDEESIALKKEEQLVKQIDNIKSQENETNKNSNTQKESQIHAIQQYSLEELRINQINISTQAAEDYLKNYKISQYFNDAKKEIFNTLNSFLKIYEMLYGKELYLYSNEKMIGLLYDLSETAVFIAIDYILRISENFPDLKKGQIYEKMKKIIDLNNEKSELFEMSYEELRNYLINQIKTIN